MDDFGAFLWLLCCIVNALATAVNVLAGNTLMAVVTGCLWAFSSVALWRALRRERR